MSKITPLNDDKESLDKISKSLIKSKENEKISDEDSDDNEIKLPAIDNDPSLTSVSRTISSGRSKRIVPHLRRGTLIWNRDTISSRYYPKILHNIVTFIVFKTPKSEITYNLFKI